MAELIAFDQQRQGGRERGMTILATPPRGATVLSVMTRAAPNVIDMPGWRPIAKRALTTVSIVSLLPMAVFYLSMSAFGLRAAVLTTVGWYYAGLLLRLVRHKPVLAAAMLGAGLLSVRAVITFLTGSAFVYFLQPVAGTIATATIERSADPPACLSRSAAGRDMPPLRRTGQQALAAACHASAAPPRPGKPQQTKLPAHAQYALLSHPP